MRLGVAVPCIERLGGKIKCLILQESLALDVSDRAANREHEPEETGSDQVTDWFGLRKQQQIKYPARKIECNRWDHRAEPDVVEQSRKERASAYKRNGKGSDHVV